MQDSDGPKAKMLKKYLGIIRFIIYGLLIVVLYNVNRILVIESNIFWPICPSSSTMDIFPIHIIILSAFSWRHIFRAFLPLLNRKIVIP